MDRGNGNLMVFVWDFSCDRCCNPGMVKTFFVVSGALLEDGKICDIKSVCVLAPARIGVVWCFS